MEIQHKEGSPQDALRGAVRILMKFAETHASFPELAAASQVFGGDGMAAIQASYETYLAFLLDSVPEHKELIETVLGQRVYQRQSQFRNLFKSPMSPKALVHSFCVNGFRALNTEDVEYLFQRECLVSLSRPFELPQEQGLSLLRAVRKECQNWMNDNE